MTLLTNYLNKMEIRTRSTFPLKKFSQLNVYRVWEKSLNYKKIIIYKCKRNFISDSNAKYKILRKGFISFSSQISEISNPQYQQKRQATMIIYNSTKVLNTQFFHIRDYITRMTHRYNAIYLAFHLHLQVCVIMV